jgi:hypothetical protein
MNAINKRIEKLVLQLVDQQVAKDDFWKAELASIMEAVDDLYVEKRRQQRRAIDGNDPAPA